MGKLLSKLVLRADEVLRTVVLWLPRLAIAAWVVMLIVLCWFDARFKQVGVTILTALFSVVFAVFAVLVVWDRIVKWARNRD